MIAQAVVAESGRLDVVVAELFPDLSRTRAAAIIREGGVSIDGVAHDRPSVPVKIGSTVVVRIPDPVPPDATPENLPLRVVYEDSALVVVDKEAGVVVHPAPGHASGTLVNALLYHVNDLSGIGGVERPGIVHRLDKGTSGLLVVAKTDAAHRELARQFATHESGRRYLAICEGAPKVDSGTIRSLLGRHPRDRKRFASGPRGKEAITHFSVRSRASGVVLIECHLETGRTHQVRVHLSEQDWPILGDPLYGRRRSHVAAKAGLELADERPLLHAWQLTLRHPDGRAMSFCAPPPEDFRAIATALGLELPS